jgi:hypothetical protein
VADIDDADARARYKEEAADQGLQEKSPRGQSGTEEDEDDRTIVAWEEGDPENPYNWSNVL